MLTSHQARAVVDTHHLSVTANAGSGKTRVLVDRYLTILLNGRASVGEIVALTYTEKAASELRRKIAETVSRELALASDPEALGRLESIRDQLSSAEIGTIHSFCARLLREHPVEADVDAAFTVLEGLDQRVLLQESIKETFYAVLQGTDETGLRERFFQVVRRLGKAKVIAFVGKMVEKRALIETLTGPQGLFARPDNEIIVRWNETLTAHVAAELASPGLVADLEAVISVATGKESPSVRDQFSLFASSPNAAGRASAFRAMMKAMLRKDKGLLKAFSGEDEDNARGAVDRLHQYRNSLIPLIDSISLAAPDPRHQILLDDSRTLLAITRLAMDRYEAKKQEAGELDFEDLQLRAKQLLENGEVRSHFASRYRYIMVDEYQDTNQLQYDILLPLLEDLSRGNLFIVGDPKQSIYGFRDADVAVFNRTKADIRRIAGPGSEVILEESFRPLRDIVAFVNHLFAGLMSADSLRGSFGVAYEPLVRARQNEATGRVEVLFHNTTESGVTEAEGIARRILYWHNSRYQVFDKEERPHDVGFRDIAVLLRSRKALPELEQAFVRNGIPYMVTGGIGYFQTQDIFDFYNYVEFLLNPADDIALAGILRSSFFNVSDAELFEVAETRKTATLWEHLLSAESHSETYPSIHRATLILLEDLSAGLRLPVPELITRIVRQTLYRGIIAGTAHGEQAGANLEKLQRMARSYEIQGFTNLYDFVRRLKRLIDEEEEEGQGTIDVRGDAVQIMTVHAAKGLEFPVVIIPTLERAFRTDSEPFFDENLGIGFKAREDDESSGTGPPIGVYLKEQNRRKMIAEEKRIFYVACTRARDMLVLSGNPDGSGKAATWMNWLQESLSSGHRFESGGLEFQVDTKSLEFSESRFVQSEQHHSLLIHLESGMESVSAGVIGTPGVEEVTLPPHLIASLPGQTKGEIFSASKIKTYLDCPSRYALRYILGFPSGPGSFRYAADEEWHDDKLPAESRGRVFHAVMQHIDALARDRNAIPGTIRRCLVAEAPFVPGGDFEMVEEIARAVDSILGSSFWREVSAATGTRTEFTISTPFGEDFLTGTLDRLFRDSDGVWNILDYKTDRIDRSGVSLRGESYLPQMKFYALLLSRFVGAPSVKVTLLFTEHPDIPVQRILRQRDLEEFENLLSSVTRRIKSGFFPPKENSCGECPLSFDQCASLFSEMK